MFDSSECKACLALQVKVDSAEVANTDKQEVDAFLELPLDKSCVSCILLKLPHHLRDYVEEKVQLCQPGHLYICDGTEKENQALLHLLEKSGRIQKLDKMKNW